MKFNSDIRAECAMTIAVTSGLVAALVSEAEAAHPSEACGLLFGTGGTVDAHRTVANVHPRPQAAFEIDPQALIDAHRAMRCGGPRLVGYFHSHPNGPPEPSETDRALAAPDGMIWAIVGEGQARFWRSTTTGFVPLSYTKV